MKHIKTALLDMAYESRLLDGTGHFIQREVPEVVVSAVLEMVPG